MILPITGRTFHVFLFAFYLLFIIFLLIKRSRKENIVIIFSFVFSIVAILSFSFSMERYIYPMEKLAGKTAFIKGFVTEEEKDSRSGAHRCIVTVEHMEVEGVEITEIKNQKIRFSNKKYKPVLGDNLEYTGELYSLYGDNEDKKLYYRSKKLVLGSFTYGKIKINKLDETEISRKEYLKKRIIKEIKDFSLKLFKPIDEYFKSEYSSVLKGMLSGDRSGFTDEQQEIFKRTGIMHLFAVSGFHTALWSMLIYKLCLVSGVGRNKACFTSIGFIFFFICFTGFPKSGIRAGIMLIVFFLGKLFKLSSDSLNSLGFSVLIILLFNPLAGGDLSLQLSASATFGILVLYPLINKKFQKRLDRINNNYIKRFLEIIVPPLIVSTAAFLATLPFMVTGFGSVSLIGPFTNLLVSEAASFIIMLSGMGSVFSLFPIFSLLTPWLYLISGLLLKYLFFVTEKLSKLKISYVQIKSGWCKVTMAAVIMLLAVSVFLSPPKWKFKVYGEYEDALNNAISYWNKVTCLLCIILVLSSSLIHSVLYKGVYTVNFADTGNGTCIICCYDKMAFIVGCGGEGGKVPSVVSNILNENQVDHVTCIIVPRKEDTESGSLGAVSSMTLPEKIYLPKTFETGEMPLEFSTEFFEGKKVLPLPDVSFMMFEDQENPVGLLKVKDLNITLFFRPGIELSKVPNEYLKSHIYYSRKAIPEELKRAGNSTIIVSDYGLDNGSIIGTVPKGISVHYRNGRYALRRLKF